MSQAACTRGLLTRALAPVRCSPLLPPRSAYKPQKALTSLVAMAATGSGAQQKLSKETPDSTWREVLGTEEYRILRQAGTEPAGSGQYNKLTEDGTYRCGGCGTPLYKSETKFDSGCGWPAFYAEIEGTVDRKVDNTFGMRRVEITCANCGGHLGHVFENEGFPNPTNERHCVNSKSLKFDKA